MTLGKPPGSRKTKRSGSSSSVHVHHLYTSRSLSGRTSLRQEVLNASAIHKRQAKDRVDHALRQDAMSTVERDELEAIRTNTTNDQELGLGGAVAGHNHPSTSSKDEEKIKAAEPGA